MNYFNQLSERLSYRKVELSDIENWTNFFIDNPRLKYLGIDLSKSAETYSKDWINRQLERYASDGLGFLAVELKDSKEFIGMGGIIMREIEGRSELEIAYSLLPKFWLNGYATEIAKQMKVFGFKNLTNKRLISIIHQENVQSMNVAQKNGMKKLFETQFQGMEVFVYGVEKE